MFKKLFFLLLIVSIALSACGTLEVRLDQTPTPAVDADQVATIVAATLAAMPYPTGTMSETAVPKLTATFTPEAPSMLPRSLYYLGSVDSQTGIGQIYRLGRDGITITKITSEIEGVTQFDVSPVDGQLVYASGNRLVLADAQGENRRVVAENSASQYYLAWPRWSPNGQTIAYVNNGIYFYALEAGISTLMLGDDENNSYSPREFSPDGSKLLVHAESTGLNHFGIYTITSRTTSPLQSSGPAKHQASSSPSSWSTDSNHIYISDWIAAGGPHGMRIPGLWRYNTDGTGAALLPLTAADGSSIFNKVAAPWQDSNGNLIYLFSPPETGIDSYSPFSLVRTDADGVSNRVVLRSETFHVIDTSLWTPDGSAVIILQNNGKGNRFANLVLIPVDPSRPVVTLLTDASALGQTLRWGP